MEMVMKFPNGETRNLLIEVFNYKRVCASQICYTSGFGGQRHGHEFDSESVEVTEEKRPHAGGVSECVRSLCLQLLCLHFLLT